MRRVTALKRGICAGLARIARPRLAEGRRLNRESGMTLIEIMVVVAIIGLLIGTVSVVAIGRLNKAKITNAKTAVGNVKNAVEHYALEMSGETCPKELQGLVAAKLLKKVPKDPWGEELIYKCPGEQDTESADIISKGPDKKEGTEDDIKSWEI